MAGDIVISRVIITHDKIAIGSQALTKSVMLRHINLWLGKNFRIQQPHEPLQGYLNNIGLYGFQA